MLETIKQINDNVNSFVWGVPAMICIVSAGLLLSFHTRFLQFRKFGYTFRVTIGRMFHKNAIKAVNYDKSWSFEEQVSLAIANKEDYHSPRWIKGYDNSVSVQKGKDGIVRGWYSEEYRDCGNGHYYLLIDAKHAIFSEND